MDDTLIDTGGVIRCLRRLNIALAWRQRGDDTLGATQLQGRLEARVGVERHDMIEGIRKIMGARRNSLLAGAALRSADGVDEVVGFGRRARARDSFTASWELFLPTGEEVRHEARHG